MSLMLGLYRFIADAETLSHVSGVALQASSDSKYLVNCPLIQKSWMFAQFLLHDATLNIRSGNARVLDGSAPNRCGVC